MQMIGDRYRLLEKLGEGGMGMVYRAFDRLTGQDVALKQVAFSKRKPGTDGSTHQTALIDEFRTLASLRHPHIISVLDYGVDHEPYFTLELLENAHPFAEYAHTQPLAQQVAFSIQLLQALTYLHRRGVIHRDIKPSNVMIVDNQVKVLDFGLAIAREHLKPESGTVGTLAYAAPEVIAGTGASVASDLYAVGVVLYEMISGELPFRSTGNKFALMLKIANAAPNFEIEPLSDHPLREVVARLLMKEASARYSSADDVISALCAAAGIERPPESTAVRDSFLQAARFVGRDAEYALLKSALRQTVSERGSAWLIGGESGVGKSRLTDELRTQALIEGALVLRGQAISEGSLPYQMWRDGLRRLIIQNDVSDYAAAVLKLLVPDMERLLERPIGESPEIDPQSLRVRLLSVIESLFRQTSRPIVLLLEDLHWADEDSLLLLQRLGASVDEMSLMIIGTYRDDEAPTLPHSVPTFKLLKLNRLTSDEIETLSAYMLGDIGKSPHVVDLIRRETEGNVFFVVEVMRALAEQAGQLADIGQKPLPTQVFAGGVQAVIRRRLDHVPESAQRLMLFAALIGREIDFSLLRALMPDINLDHWLQQVATVIEVNGERYQFAHDKLRETLLAGVSAAERPALHRQIASAIESIYPDAPSQYAALTYHWAEAHDAEKTVYNATRAGELALRAGSYREAIRFFEQALSLADEARLNTRQLSNLHYLIGDAYWGQTDMGKSREWHFKALRLLGRSVPETDGQLRLGTLRQFATHVARHFLRITPRNTDDTNWLIVARALHQVVQGTYHDENFKLGVYCLLTGINASDRAGKGEQARRFQALYYSTFGFAMGDIAQHRFARYYFSLAGKRLQNDSDPETQAWFDLCYSMYLAGRGQWEQATSRMKESIELSHAAGSLRLWGDISEYQTYVFYLQSRLIEALNASEAAAEFALRDGHVQGIGRFHIVKSWLLLMRGRLEEARAQYFDNRAAIQAALNVGAQTAHRIAACGFEVEYAIRTENWNAALQAADSLNRFVASAQTVSWMMAGAAAASLALYLTLWEQGTEGDYPQKTAEMLNLYHHKFARTHDIGQPIEALYRAWYHWLRGEEAHARDFSAQAIDSAKTYQMPYFEALAHYHFGRFLPTTDPERNSHLERAKQLFTQTGADFDAARTAQLIGDEALKKEAEAEP